MRREQCAVRTVRADGEVTHEAGYKAGALGFIRRDLSVRLARYSARPAGARRPTVAAMDEAGRPATLVAWLECASCGRTYPADMTDDMELFVWLAFSVDCRRCPTCPVLEHYLSSA